MRYVSAAAPAVLALSASLLGAGQLTAQQSVPNRLEAKARTGPRGTGTGARPQILLEGGEANNKAEVTLGLGQWMRLTASAPVGSGATSTDFATLDGLSDKLSFKAAAKLFDFGLAQRNPETTAGAQEAICRKHGLPRSTVCSDGALEEYLENRGTSGRDVRDAVLEFDRASFDDGLLWAVGIEVGLANGKFEYFSPSADSMSVRHTSSSVGASIGAIYGPGLVSLSLNFETSYTNQVAVAHLCEKVSEESALERCAELPLGSPAKKNSVIPRLEWRHIFNGWALAPTVSWDPQGGDDVLGVDLPIYAIPNSSGQLLGGVRIGWRSDTERVAVSAFLSKPIAGF